MSDDLFAKFANWLLRINQSEEIPTDLSAFNFGVFQTPSSYSIYLIGAKQYDSGDDNWASEEDFAPAEKYFELPVSFKNKHWKEIEDFIVDFVVRFVNSTEFERSFLSKASTITVGFDDGNLRKIK